MRDSGVSASLTMKSRFTRSVTSVGSGGRVTRSTGLEAALMS